MKRFFVLFFIFVLSFTLAACDRGGNDGKVGVLTWSGLEDEYITRGDNVDLLDYVTVVDSIDNDISDKIIVKDDDNFTTTYAAGYTVTYEVENSTGVKEAKTKDFIVRVGANVANGSFEMKNLGWKLDNPGGVSTISYDGQNAKILISNAGNSWWGIQLYQTGILFEQGTTYKLSLKASSADGQSIAAGYEDVDGNSAMLPPGFMAVKLTEEVQVYEMYYTATANFSNVKVVIYLGHMLPTDKVSKGSTHSVTIDDVYVEKVEVKEDVFFEGVNSKVVYSGVTEFDAMAGVSATTANDEELTDQIKVLGTIPTNIRVEGDYFVTYLIEHEDGRVSFYNRRINHKFFRSQDWKAINGDFISGLEGWTQDVNQTNGTGEAEFTENLEEKTISIKVTDVSTAGWHIQLQQSGIKLVEGQEYKLVFTAKTDVSRKIDLEVVNPLTGYSAIAANPELKGIELTTEWETFEISFTVDKNYSDVKIGLHLGKIGNTANDITVSVSQLQLFHNNAGVWE